MPSVAHIIRRRNNRKIRKQEHNERTRLWTMVIALLVGSVIIVPTIIILGTSAYLYLRTLSIMPTPAQTTYLDPIIGPTNIYDSSGSTLLYSVTDPLGNERQWLELDDLPPHVISATLQMEDPNFLEQTSFSLTDTLSQLWRYVLGNPVRTENSIANNLVQNALIAQARGSGLDTSLMNIVFTAELKRRYSPEQILEWLLNANYYGNDAYGIDAAARVYLGKSARDLTLDEAALLAPITLAPEFNPFDNETAARGRQGNLLSTMLLRGVITEEEFNRANATETVISRGALQLAQVAPEFSVYAREQAEDILYNLGLDGARLISRGGLTITTTLDLDMYYQMECALRAHLTQLRGDSTATVPTLTGEPCTAAQLLQEPFGVNLGALPDEGSLMLMDALTGEIRAMVGSVTATNKQPGPLLQPFAYLQGFLSTDYTPATMVLDIPQPFPGPSEGLIYNPQNPDGEFRGPLNLRDAMVSHLLPPVVSVANQQGLNRVIDVAHQIGINTLQLTTHDLSLMEQGGRVSLLDSTYAYSVFAAMGVQRGVDTEPVARNYRARNPVAVKRIEDAEGNVLWQYDDDAIATSQTIILQDSVAFLINNILSDHGTRRRVLGIDDTLYNIGRPAAIVNGLTGNDVENWTIGYTPQLVLGVHLSRSDDAAMTLDAHGHQGALTLWNAVMRYANQRDAVPEAGWTRPDSVAQYEVCDRSGLIPPEGSECPTRDEWFARTVPPYQEDTFWRTVEVNSQSNLLASLTTPPNLIVENVYFVPPAAAMDWWKSNNQPLPPTEYDTRTRPQEFRAVQIDVPEDYAYVGGQVDIRAGIQNPDFSSYQLSYGQGLNPTQWINIGEPRTDYTEGQSIGIWDTTTLDTSVNPIYTLQLSVTYPDGTNDIDFVQVSVDNTPPTISLQAGEIGEEIFQYPATSEIPIIATVEDNLRIDRVEFYRNQQLIGERTEWPYAFNFQVDRTGIEIFSATVFDQVGNTATAEIQIEIVRGSG